MDLVHEDTVQQEWIDYNGHMSEAFYVLVFGHATDDFLDTVGLDSITREERHVSAFTVEAHIRYLDQARSGDPLYVTTLLTDVDAKRARIFHTMTLGREGRFWPLKRSSCCTSTRQVIGSARLTARFGKTFCSWPPNTPSFRNPKTWVGPSRCRDEQSEHLRCPFYAVPLLSAIPLSQLKRQPLLLRPSNSTSSWNTCPRFRSLE